MPQVLPSAADMIDINTAIIVLALALIGVATTAAVTFGAIIKWYLPNQFKLRDKQREIEIDALKKQLENKNTSDAVDIEKERMLPLAFQSNQMLATEAINMSKSFNTTMQLRTEQDAVNAAALVANTRQLSIHSERLEEVENKLIRLHDKFTVVFPRDKSIDELFGELKAVVGTTKQIVHEHTGDTKPIPPIHADITIHTPKEEPPTLPDDELKPTGTA